MLTNFRENDDDNEDEPFAILGMELGDDDWQAIEINDDYEHKKMMSNLNVEVFTCHICCSEIEMDGPNKVKML